MMSLEPLRVAWLFPSLALGNYWHPVLSEFTKIAPQTIVYTGLWPGFSAGFESAFTVKVVGKMQFANLAPSTTGYNQGVIYLSPKIGTELLQFKPDVIFATGFCLWTLFCLLLKPLGHWQVIISYEGSSPGVDYCDSPLRSLSRKIMARLSDAFITNSHAGKAYLSNHLGVDERQIFVRPYQVPDVQALQQQTGESVELVSPPHQTPVFLFTGQVIHRKGVSQLLEACKILRDQGCTQYTLLMAGEGPQKEEMQAFCQEQGLTQQVHWLGWIDYGQLGAYFRNADIFILPTLEDTWGMVILEAMAFGKPVLCSRWAGASELVIDGENGSLFDPHQPQEIAQAMKQLIDHPELIATMGQRSQALISHHTPTKAAEFLAKVADTVGGTT